MKIRIDIQVERWSIDRLIPRITNPRTHTPEQVAQVAASMREFGWTSPILVGGDNDVLAGHARLLAARQLGMTEVPVIQLGHLSEAQRRALVIADNQLAISGASWDEETLRLELAALSEQSFDLSLVGFDDEELARLLAAEEATEGLTDEDAVPEVAETPVTMPGDCWRLGKDHILLVGDATVPTDVERLMAGDSADLVFIDTPYNTDYEGYTEERLTIQNDRMSDTDFKHFLEAVFRSCHAAINPGSASSRTRWRPPASRSVARSSGRRTHSPGALADTNSSTSQSSIAMSPGKAMPGMGTNRNPRCGKRTNRQRIGCIRP
jgi:hypothetical protein